MTKFMTSKSCFLFEFFIYFLLLGTMCLPSFILKLLGYVGSENLFDYIDVLETIICVCLLSFFIKGVWRKIFLGLFVFSIGVFNFLDFESAVLMRSSFKEEYLLILFHSNWREISEFVRSILSYKLILGGFVCFGGLFIIPFLPCETLLSIKKKYYFFIPLCFFCYLFISFIFFQSVVVQNIIGVVHIYFVSEKLADTYLPKSVDNVTDLNFNVKKKLYVIVLSDAVSRNYLSLYDYPYNTSPFLKRRRDSLYVFDNIVTQYDWTHLVLYSLLIFSGTYKQENAFPEESTHLSDFYNLLDVFNAADFKVYWLSSNSRFDYYSYLTSRARTTFFYTRYDDELLPLLKTAINDDTDKKVVFLHLKGSHQLYSARYPKHYADDNELILALKQMEKVDKRFVEYVKTLLYGDDFLSKVFSMVGSKDNISSYILYLSDHGEDVDVYGNASFMHGGMDKRQVLEIPFVLWLSETYKANNKEFVDGLSKNLHRPYEISILNHSLLNLSRLSTSFLDETKSIFSRAYKERPRKYDALSD